MSLSYELTDAGYTEALTDAAIETGLVASEFYISGMEGRELAVDRFYENFNRVISVSFPGVPRLIRSKGCG